MAITAIRLDDQAGNTLQLVPHADITITALNLGYPDVRGVVEDRPDTNGQRDTTALHGGRAVSITAGVYTTPAALADQWRRFMAPAARSYLYVSDTEWGAERRILLRADRFEDPIEDDADDVYRAVTAQWRAPDGVWEAVDPTLVSINAYVAGNTGMIFPMLFPIAFGAETQATSTLITNTAAVPLHFKARLYGQCDGPVLVNDTTGQQIKFKSGTDGLQLAPGVYVEVDTKERSANLNSDPNGSKLSTLDFVNSTWFQLQPGLNSLRFVPSTGIFPGASAVIEYRPTYL